MAQGTLAALPNAPFSWTIQGRAHIRVHNQSAGLLLMAAIKRDKSKKMQLTL